MFIILLQLMAWQIPGLDAHIGTINGQMTVMYGKNLNIENPDSFVVYARVIKRTFDKNVRRYELSSGHILFTEDHDLMSNAIKADKYYWFAFDPKDLCILRIAKHKKDVSGKITNGLNNLIDAANDLEANLRNLQVAERAVVLRAAGVVITGAWTLFNAVQTVNAVMVWEPFNAVLGVALTAAGAVFTAAQYEELTEAQKRGVDAMKAFEAALTQYHCIVNRYLPEDLQGCHIDDVRFTKVISIIKRVLPEVKLDGFRTNNVSYA